MTIWIMRDGNLVKKRNQRWKARSDLPTPRVSRFETMESPVTGKDISSWRQRDADMKAADAVDVRDIPQKLFDKRREMNERNGRAEPAS